MRPRQPEYLTLNTTVTLSHLRSNSKSKIELTYLIDEVDILTINSIINVYIDLLG